MRRAFTLLELLVVIAIITALAALMLPALAGAKARAKLAYCANNLKQDGAALAMYLNDFQQQYPTYGLRGFKRNEAFWDGQLAQYSSVGAFYCPTRPWNCASNWDWSFNGIFYPNRSYEYNSYGTDFFERYPGPTVELDSIGLSVYFHYHPPSWRKENEVLAPSSMVAVADANVDADDDGDGDPNPQWLYPLGLSGKWHGGQVAAASCDGHVEARRMPYWQTNRFRFNIDNLPHDK